LKRQDLKAFEAARFKGSENNDPITMNGFQTNRSGGILGGISNGDEIVLRAAMKPIPSITREQDTIDREGRPSKMKFTGRHDIVSMCLRPWSRLSWPITIYD